MNWKKGLSTWKAGKTLFISVPFTWLLSEAEEMASCHKGRVIAGGPAVKLLGAEWADETPESTPYDVLSTQNPFATFTSRGCPNKCEFCAVPKIEGDLVEMDSWKHAPIICDNNLLACTDRHFSRVIESLKIFDGVDFNQGLDARIFNKGHAQKISKLRNPHVRFAFDHVGMESTVIKAIDTARAAGIRNLSIYVLIGFKDTPEDAEYRLEFVRKMKIRPNPMRYQPIWAIRKNDYIGPGWTESQLLRMSKYYSRLCWYDHIPFQEFHYHETGSLFQG